MRISDWSSDVCSSDLARATYDSARANTIAQRNALADAYQALTEITGTSITNLQGLPDDFRPELPAGGDAETWVASAMENNPSLRSLEYQVSSAEQGVRSEEHTSELQSLMRSTYAVYCLKKKKNQKRQTNNN